MWMMLTCGSANDMLTRHVRGNRQHCAGLIAGHAAQAAASPQIEALWPQYKTIRREMAARDIDIAKVVASPIFTLRGEA